MFSFRNSNSSKSSASNENINDDDKQRIQKMIGFMKIQTDERIEEICHITNQEIRSKTKNYEEQFLEQESKNVEKYEQNIKTKYLIQSSEISSEQKKKILQAEWKYLEQIKKFAASRIQNMNYEDKKAFLESCLVNALEGCEFNCG